MTQAFPFPALRPPTAARTSRSRRVLPSAACGPGTQSFFSVAEARKHEVQARSLLLGAELGLADAGAPQLDVEDALHGGEHLLVGGCGAALKVGDDGLGGVALCGEVLLGHLGLNLLTGSRDDIADGLADGVGLDDVVGAVDLGEALAFNGGAGLRGIVSIGGSFGQHVRVVGRCRQSWGGREAPRDGRAVGGKGELTALPEANFFSVATAPERRAALMPLRPRTTVSRWEAPPPRVLLPILVTVSQSSDMFAVLCAMYESSVVRRCVANSTGAR